MATPVVQPHSGLGTDLRMEDPTTTGTFNHIALAGTYTGPQMSRDTQNTLNHDNPDGYAEFIGGTKDGGSLDFPVYFDPDDPSHFGPKSLMAAFEDGLRHKFQMIFPSKDYAFSFQGVVVKCNFSFPVDGPQTADISIKISGKPNLGPYTPPAGLEATRAPQQGVTDFETHDQAVSV